MQERVAAGGPLRDQPDDLVVALRVERGERQVLQLPLDRVHAEPVRQRSVDLQGLPRLAFLLVLGQETQRPHVVQAVGELDHQDARVLGHRDDHLPDRLALGGVPGFDPVELGHPVDHDRDELAELVPDPVEADVSVFDGVVQEGGAQGRDVHAEIGEDARHRHRMGDVGLAASAQLAGVCGIGELERPLDGGQIGFRMAVAQAPHHRLQQRRPRPRRRQAQHRGPAAAVARPRAPPGPTGEAPAHGRPRPTR